MALLVGGAGLVVALEPRFAAANRRRRLASRLRLSAMTVEAVALGAVADVHGLFGDHGYVDLPGATHLERNLVFVPGERRLELSGCGLR